MEGCFKAEDRNGWSERKKDSRLIGEPAGISLTILLNASLPSFHIAASHTGEVVGRLPAKTS